MCISNGDKQRRFSTLYLVDHVWFQSLRMIKRMRKVDDSTYEQGLIRVGENYSNAYRAYTWHSPSTVPLSSHPLGHPISVGVAGSWLDV